MADLYMEPTNPKANRLHLLDPAFESRTLTPEELSTPGTRGLFRARCGTKLVAVVLGDPNDLTAHATRLCERCSKRGNP